MINDKIMKKLSTITNKAKRVIILHVKLLSRADYNFDLFE
jgi:hypothetical protein